MSEVESVPETVTTVADTVTTVPETVTTKTKKNIQAELNGVKN